MSVGTAATRLLRTFHFCSQGNGEPLLTFGFSSPEPNHVWAIRAMSGISLPASSATTSILVLHLCPFLHGELASGFHLRAFVDGAEAFSGRVDGEIVIGMLVSARNPTEASTTITFECDGATTPIDAGLSAETRPLKFRLMSGWLFECLDDWTGHRTRLYEDILPDSETTLPRIAEVTGLTPPNLVTAFESLGHSCDFGLMQRHVGAEPLGLLRFAGGKTANVFRGLMTSFCNIGLPGTVSTYVVDGYDEYWIYDAQFGLRFHTFVPPNAAAPEQVIARETYRLPLLARKLMEDVDNGEKIFLLRSPEPLSRAEALAIWAALNLKAHNTLLYLNNIGGQLPGGVRELGPRLMCGHLDWKLGNVPQPVEVWLSICANAYLALRGAHQNPQ